MVDGGSEPELWGREWEVIWESHLSFEIATMVNRVFVKDHDTDVPDEDVGIIFQVDVERRNGLFGVGKFSVLS